MILDLKEGSSLSEQALIPDLRRHHQPGDGWGRQPGPLRTWTALYQDLSPSKNVCPIDRLSGQDNEQLRPLSHSATTANVSSNFKDDFHSSPDTRPQPAHVLQGQSFPPSLAYSLSAWGSFCICSRMSRMAGSLMICCTSGSAMARRFTSSGLSCRLYCAIIQRW